MFGFTSLEARSYLVLCVCGSLQILINQIEQPYARSLIVCDTPVNASEHSGSRYCGDRLHVIGQGALLSGSGESFENVGRFAMTLFVSGFADSHGRKAAAVIGWVLIGASVVCFFLASFIAPWARVLFIVAQGLQGMSGLGLICEIVVADIVNGMEGDTIGVYTRRNIVAAIFGVISFGTVLLIQYAEIEEFRPVWGSVVVLSAAILVILVMVFPETQKEEDRGKRAQGSVSQVVVDEVKLYGEMMVNRPFVRYTIIELFFINISQGFMIIIIPWMMASFGYVQLDVMLRLGPSIVMGLLFQPLVPHLCGKFGHRAAWRFVWWFNLAAEWLLLPFIGMSFWGLAVPWLSLYVRTPMSGFQSLAQSVGSRVVKSTEIAKYTAMLQLMGFITGSISPLLYTYVFDPETSSYLRKIMPFVVASCIKMCGNFVYWFGHAPIVMEECDRMTEESRREAKAAAEKKDE